MNTLIRSFGWIGIVILAFAPRVSAQSAIDKWPIPTVAFFDCNSSAAQTENPSQRSALNTASKTLMKSVLADTSTRDVFIFSFGFSDTTSTDLASGGKTFSLPDSGGSIYTVYEYLIASKITGKPGAYELTVWLQEQRSSVHIVEGTAQFITADIASVDAACLSATKNLQPLISKIHAFQLSLKSANPQLIINPQIDLLPEKINPALNSSMSISVTAVDVDGTPLVRRLLKFSATKGSVTPDVIQTDDKGKASVTFNAGKAPGASVVTAVMEKMASVRHDTTDYSGGTSLILGTADLKNLWSMDFDASRSYTGCKDETIPESDGTRWKQKNDFWTERCRGTFIGEPNGSDNTEFYFNDSTLSVSGMYFYHNFSKETFTDMTGKKCPSTDWRFGGSTRTYSASRNEDEDGSGSLNYDPLGICLFSVEVPLTFVDAYGYNWAAGGRWENGQCVSDDSHFGMHVKIPLNMTGGVTVWGSAPIRNLTMTPWYSGKTIVGYTIFYSNSTSGYASDASFYVTSSRCFATIKPLSVVTSVESGQQSATQFWLSQNYPNPFNPSTSFSFSIPVRTFVSLKVFDALGREVCVVADEELPAGQHIRRWDARSMPSGVYFCRLTAGSFTETKKVMLVR
ncbi:MAG TPA: T9SS type A sorting domain-containing protein [Bacteroidota bacterium]|nr:T9SS type A sorting domain-containing protein [Bacteroidota bacterium]